MTSPTPLQRLHLEAPRRLPAGTLSVRGTLRARESVRIRLRDDEGHVGLGEALPLPGYSRDDAASAERVLATIAARVAGEGLQVPDVAQGVAAGLDSALAPHAVLLGESVSARFALECGLLDLLARRAGVSAAHWLAEGRVLQRVPVSLLLPDDDRAVVAAASTAVAGGFRVLKLKIARADRSEDEEEHLLGALRAAIDAAGAGRAATVTLRLDANGALDPARVAGRLVALRRYGIELVEEPLAGAALLGMAPLAVPWAADESLADPALAAALLDLPPGRRPAALVLKPALLGLVRCLRLADAAAACGVGVIVTHGLDGDLGYAAACALAAALRHPTWPCGLAPHAGLRQPRPALPGLPLPTAPGLGVADTQQRQ
jgi:L-alanine-DL-glutamate epimerase-like enolase superfamily enzyme